MIFRQLYRLWSICILIPICTCYWSCYDVIYCFYSNVYMLLVMLRCLYMFQCVRFLSTREGKARKEPMTLIPLLLLFPCACKMFKLSFFKLNLFRFVSSIFMLKCFKLMKLTILKKCWNVYTFMIANKNHIYLYRL